MNTSMKTFGGGGGGGEVSRLEKCIEVFQSSGSPHWRGMLQSLISEG